MKKFALITGASSGIGLAYSKRLAELHYNLLLVSNQQQQLDDLAAEISERYGVQTATLFIDLARETAAQEVFDFCNSNDFEIEILINNAGMFFFKPMYDVDIKRVSAMLYLHVVTPALLCKLFGGQMQKRQSGHILNMSSMAAWMKLPTISIYGPTKAFMRNFSLAIREEFFDDNVKVLAVCPGAVATGLYNLSEKYQKLGIKLGIIIQPEKLAKKAINQLFKGKKQYIAGGFINYLAIFFTHRLPHFLTQIIWRKIRKWTK
ncbi:MAG: SDR family NAD(P)-dependent oxidoreductase [Prevotellaceae bacterium]|jgi:short-subunit dehydrogenase|nr:SDR family NAD(P)-dependent oxidoreductase [Prevotellaceae bacterium]